MLSFATGAPGAALTNTNFPSLKEVREKWDAQSLETVQRAAEAGELTARHYLGFCYASGDRVLKDGPTAVKWYERAAGAGYLPSYINLGLLYQQGQVLSRDLAKALRYSRLAADSGLKQGQVNLGVLYRDGVGVERDPAEALKWFRLAAAQDHTTAMVEIGRAYRFGYGVEQDPREANKWFEQAAGLGEPLAELNLGMAYEGQGNLQTAAKFYRQAADHGLADAMWVMHNLYENGAGVTRDLAEAMRWLRKGAEAGSARAQFALGYHHEYPGHDSANRVGDESASMAEAVKWYRRAAEQYMPGGQYRLAECYLAGKGVELDEERGLELMRAAADGGYANAMVELTELYARGIGEPRNREDQPLQLLKRAETIKEQTPYGIYNRPYDLLIFRYEHGIGAARDLVAAATWYVRGAMAGAYNYSLEGKLDYVPTKQQIMSSGRGHPERSTLQITLPGDSPSSALSELLAVCLQAAQPNGGTNALKIAERFVTGRDVPVSPIQAWVWFNLAAQHGATEGAARARGLEQKLSPADLAQARKELGQLKELLDGARQAIRKR